MILKLDYPDFQTTEENDVEIFSGKKNPRASIPEKTGNCLDELVDLHKEFKEREVPKIIPVLGVFFHKGLDYLETTRKHSKRAVDKRWPNVDGIRGDTDEAQVFPLSKRAVISAIALSQAFEMIAEARGEKIESSVPVFLESLRLTVPYSGVLADNFVHQEYDGDVYSAYDAVLGRGSRNRQQIMDKLEDLKSALVLAEAGKRDEGILGKIASESEGKWFPVRSYISAYSKRREQNPSEEGIKMKTMLDRLNL